MLNKKQIDYILFLTLIISCNENVNNFSGTNDNRNDKPKQNSEATKAFILQ